MLGAIERKLAAILGDGLAARTHLSVVEGPAGSASPADPAPGRGLLVVGLAAFDSVTRFGPDVDIPDAGKLRPRRRGLPLDFRAQLDFLQTPPDATDLARADARALQLDDLSLAAHLLAGPDVQSGQAFEAAGDAGYRVVRLAVERASLTQLPTRAALTASLECRGEAVIWPPGAVGAGRLIAAVDRVLEPLPVRIDVSDRLVRAGGSTTLTVRSVGGRRLVDPTSGQTAPLALAVTVASDLPLGQRGTIQSGDPGAETGVQIVAADAGGTPITYRAPAGALGSVRTEYVAIHLATPEGRTGVLLGSAAVNLAPAGP